MKKIFLNLNLKMNFNKTLESTIKGFHIINKNPIIERNWEEIFVQAYKNNGNSIIYNSGSHTSGVDCVIDNVKYSNKTSKIKNNKVNISSYRLTKCNNDINHIIKEIDIVRKNFNYYALLAREEIDNKIIYNYYKIPANFFEAKNFIWVKKYTKLGKFSGWKTNTINNISLDINESMSSQLWIHTNKDSIKQYLENIIIVPINKNTIDYYQIFTILKSFL